MKERQEEILNLNQTLAKFGVRFSELVHAPKNTAESNLIKRIGRYLAEQPHLMDVQHSTKALPVNGIAGNGKTIRRMTERYPHLIIVFPPNHCANGFPFSSIG